jgi:hypothetical protein
MQHTFINATYRWKCNIPLEMQHTVGNATYVLLEMQHTVPPMIGRLQTAAVGTSDFLPVIRKKIRIAFVDILFSMVLA